MASSCEQVGEFRWGRSCASHVIYLLLHQRNPTTNTAAMAAMMMRGTRTPAATAPALPPPSSPPSSPPPVGFSTSVEAIDHTTHTDVIYMEFHNEIYNTQKGCSSPSTRRTEAKSTLSLLKCIDVAKMEMLYIVPFWRPISVWLSVEPPVIFTVPLLPVPLLPAPLSYEMMYPVASPLDGVQVNRILVRSSPASAFRLVGGGGSGAA